MYLTGVLQAFGIVILSAIFNVYIRTVSLYFDIDPVVFVFSRFLSTGLVFCFIGGPGKLVKEALFSAGTWAYGLALGATFAIDLYLVKYVSGTEMGLFCRLAVPICMILALVLLNRKLKTPDFIAILTIFAGGAILIGIQDPQHQMTLIIFAVILSLAISATHLIPEVHKENVFAQKFGSMRLKIRVIGLAMFSTAMIALGVICVSSFFKSTGFIGNESILYSQLPDLTIFRDLPSILTGVIWGMFFSPFILYFTWSSTYKINAETVLVISSLIPITTLGIEYSLSFLPIFNINMSTFADGHGQKVLLVVILMTIGAGLSAYIKTYQKIKEAAGDTFWDKVKNSAKVESAGLNIKYATDSLADYEIIKNTVDFYEGDLEKTAFTLELPEETVRTLYYGKNQYSLKDDASKKIHEIFRNKIFYLDQLTGIENKKGLIKTFTDFQEKEVKFNLYYLDVNKFKQINDNLSHNIGDITLMKVAKRLKSYAENNDGQAFRLGGDEFAIITHSNKPEDVIISEIKDKIREPIKYDSDGLSGTLTPSISVGRANVIKDKDLKIKDLIASADEKMYADKKLAHAEIAVTDK